MQKNRKRVRFFKSLTWQMDRMVLIITMVAIAFTILVAAPSASSAIDHVTSDYISDLVSSKGMMIERAIDAANDKNEILINQSESLLKNCRVRGMNTSYAYLVDADGTMVYHPTKEKIGQPVENSVIKGVISDIKAGKPVKNQTVLYNFNGIKKYAGYYIPKDKSFVVVISCDYSEIMTPVRNLIKKMILLGIFTACAAGMVTFFVMKKKLAPVEQLSACIDKMKDLDLTEDAILTALRSREDEFGMMSRSIGDMGRSLSGTIKTIDEQAENLASASDTLLENADSVSKTSDQIDSAVNEIAQGATSQAQETQNANNAVIEIGDQISEVSANIDSLNAVSEEMADANRTAGAMISGLNNANQKTQDAINGISDSTRKTNASASEIKEAASLISDIAKQTNLLSLNASIEAARAGEHGKGFAVVAESIGDLANQSKDAAEKIDEIIEKLVDDSTNAMTIMDDVTVKATEQSDEIKKTSEAFEKINKGIEKSGTAIGKISEQADSMNQSKTSIIKTLENLSAIAEENAAGTEESSASVTQMTASMNDIRTQSEGVKASAEKLMQEVKKFKI